MSSEVYWNNTPFKVKVNNVLILPNCCEKLDSDDPTVIRMLDSGLLGTERIQKVEQSGVDRAITMITNTTKDEEDGLSTTAEPSEVRFAGETVYEGLPRVEPINSRGGNKRPLDSMGSY